MAIRASDTLTTRIIRQTLNRVENIGLDDAQKFSTYSSLLAAAASIENEMLRTSVVRYVDTRISKLKAAS